MITIAATGPWAAISGILAHDFMRNAFLAGTASAMLGGPVGYFVVLRGLAFSGEALGHVAFTAALGSILLGFDPLIGIFVVTAGIAIGMASLAPSVRMNDVAVGAVLAWILGLGALFLFIYTSSASAGGANGQAGLSALFGSILGIQPPQVITAAAVAAVALLALGTIGRPLLFASLDPEVAAVRGVPVRVLGAVFLVVVAVTVTDTVQVVGALLVLTLLVMPAAIARRWSVQPARALALSTALAISFVWGGLVFAYYLPYPATFFITSIAFAVYVGDLAVETIYGRVRQAGQAPLERPQPVGYVG